MEFMAFLFTSAISNSLSLYLMSLGSWKESLQIKLCDWKWEFMLRCVVVVARLFLPCLEWGWVRVELYVDILMDCWLIFLWILWWVFWYSSGELFWFVIGGGFLQGDSLAIFSSVSTILCWSLIDIFSGLASDFGNDGLSSEQRLSYLYFSSNNLYLILINVGILWCEWCDGECCFIFIFCGRGDYLYWWDSWLGYVEIVRFLFLIRYCELFW